MYEYQYDPSGIHEYEQRHRRGGVMSLVRMGAAVAGVAFFAVLFLGLGFWAFGIAFQLVGVLLRIAFVVWLGMMVWRHLIRPRRRRYP